MDLKTEIINYARSNGASVVGFAPVERFKDAPKGHGPTDFMPKAKTVICMGLGMPRRLVDWDGALKDSEIIPNDDVRHELESGHWYGRIGYEAMNIRLDQLGLLLAMFLEDRDFRSVSFPATYAAHAGIMQKVPGYFGPFSHRHAAVACGLGEFGYNSLVVNPKYGSRIRFMSVVTEAEIEPDPYLSKPVCLGEKCLLCIKNCGIQGTDTHAITPIEGAKREDGIFKTMPSIVDKHACFVKFHGKAKCWGKCMAACPIGK